MLEAIERVRQMELLFDRLQKIINDNPDAIREDASVQIMLQSLVQYYESGQWQQDYELDGKGLFPQCLKRGILAQDAIYDFLDAINK